MIDFWPGALALLWAARALSIFNTVALVWLGLTVLLNAERRPLGVWLAGGALLVGGCFFAGHSLMIGRDPWALAALIGGLGPASSELEFWWHASWVPLIAAPYVWYAVLVWYSGQLEAPAHRLGLATTGILGIVGIGLLGTLVPRYDELLSAEPFAVPTIAGFPVASVLYPAYAAVTIALSLAVLGRPARTRRFLGDLARQRARPWLAVASLVLLIVSLSVGGAMAWLVRGLHVGTVNLRVGESLAQILFIDVLVAAELAAAVVLMGRAVVSYEVFTGKPLPRGGLFRDWRNSLALAAVCGLVLGTSLDISIDPAYRLVLATVLISGFYAFTNWRAHADRERSIERLRPFLSTQRLYDSLLNPTEASDAPLAEQLRALCEEMLPARVAYLVALGPVAPLVRGPLAYPKQLEQPLPALDETAFTRDSLSVPLDSIRYRGARWAVPLWSEHALIGAFLLGDKRDGSLYTQEEMEVARAAGERLLDARASAELGRRLVSLQRRRLVESQMLDQRTRRTLHDNVLPRLHAAMLAVRDDPSSAISTLSQVHRDVAALLRTLPSTLTPDVARFGLVPALRRAADEDVQAIDRVTWRLAPAAEDRVRGISPMVAELLFSATREVIRNAVRHGRGEDPTRGLQIEIALEWRDGVVIEVVDNGVGIDELGRAPGRGAHGLEIYGTLLAVLGGALTATSAPGGPTRVVVFVPEDALTSLSELGGAPD